MAFKPPCVSGSEPLTAASAASTHDAQDVAKRAHSGLRSARLHDVGHRIVTDGGDHDDRAPCKGTGTQAMSSRDSRGARTSPSAGWGLQRGPMRTRTSALRRWVQPRRLKGSSPSCSIPPVTSHSIGDISGPGMVVRAFLHAPMALRLRWSPDRPLPFPWLRTGTRGAAVRAGMPAQPFWPLRGGRCSRLRVQAKRRGTSGTAPFRPQGGAGSDAQCGPEVRGPCEGVSPQIRAIVGLLRDWSFARSSLWPRPSLRWMR